MGSAVQNKAQSFFLLKPKTPTRIKSATTFFIPGKKPSTRLVASTTDSIQPETRKQVGEELELEEVEEAEKLECLEEEAIAGKDDGREPLDYDRRAQIFCESSRVFQKLKDKTSACDVSDSEGKQM